MRKFKPYAHLVSIHLPKRIKSEAWLLWDRRMMWQCCRSSLSGFDQAYGMIRHFESVREHLMQACALQQSNAPDSRLARN